MRNYPGSNQHETKHRIVDPETWASIWFVAFMVAFILPFMKEKIISPLSESPLVVQADEPEKSELQKVIGYITYKFEPEGKDVVVRAINCFYSESGLRPLAYGWNEWNKTSDVGVAQVNSVHGWTVEQLQDYKFNIDKAYELYKASNSFSPWYGKGCK